MSLFRVLHLSDIHIGDTYMDSKDIAYRIISAIESENINCIQSVVVTGDIFEGKCGLNDDIVTEAIDFFNIIYEEIKKSSNIEKTDFLFVPGNHDIIREKSEPLRWEKYSAFLKGFYGDIPSFYDCNDFSLLKTYDEYRIAFVGFNSCGLKEAPLLDTTAIANIRKIDNSEFESVGINKNDLLRLMNAHKDTNKFMDYGEISTKQILNKKRDLSKYDDYYTVAFFHHHFYLFPEVYSKYGDSSLIRNYTNVIQQLQQAHVKTVLHGHKHFDLESPLITDSYYENSNNLINIIAGGSVGTNRVTKHTFNIIDFYDKDSDIELVQRKIIYNNDHLEPIVIKQIPPKSTKNNSSIRLLQGLEFNNPDLFSKLIEAVDKINLIVDDYNNVLKWLENVFVGFEEMHKVFESNPLCVFFLLFSVNYRILKNKQLLGKEKIDKSYYNILNDLLFSIVEDVGFDKKQYLKIFEQSDLNKLKEKCDEIFDNVQNKRSKFYLSFSMIGIFITDIYLMLRYYAGSFYNSYIKYKVNIKLDETEFHQNVPVQKIMIHSDADRRGAFIDLRCNSATAHKLAVLFVKQFELIISKFEDYFKTVGLKLYYLTPKIEKNSTTNTIDNYNFEAYIPTLIPLLTGDNIYAKKEVFARELIQNSIDAIAVRASVDKDFDQTIYITFGISQGRKFFKIRDYGTGMDRFKIERYFTSIGRSFYSGDEYRDLDIGYKPISNFGIGFLSAFMICREIDVKTRYYLDEKEGLRLHIPNYDGCFFIEKDDTLEIGTEITLYIDKEISNDIKIEEIIEYICKTMQDISCDICIKDEINNGEIRLEAKNIRKRLNNREVLFVPFLESGKIVEDVSIKNTVHTGAYITDFPYGLLVDVTGNRLRGSVLNSGIRLNASHADDVWSMLSNIRDRKTRYLSKYFLFNLPSNYFNIDVSREKITEFLGVVSSDFKIKLMQEIYKQTVQYFDLCKEFYFENRAINLHMFLMILGYLCKADDDLSHLHNNIMSMGYKLYVCFNSESLDLIVSRSSNRPDNAVPYIQNNYQKCKDLFFDFLKKNSADDEIESLSIKTKYLHKIIPNVRDVINRKDIWETSPIDDYYFYRYQLSKEAYINELKSSFHELLKNKDDSFFYSFLIVLAFMLKKDEGKLGKEHAVIMENVLTLMLESFSVSDIENGTCKVSIGYDEIKRVIKKITMA